MNKTDYIYMVLDNILVYNINLPPEFQNNGVDEHLNKFDENYVKIIAGFNKSFLEHFLTISKGKSQNDIAELLKKMEKIAYMVGPIGNLSYLGSDQVDHILTKINDLKIDEIIEEKISLVADDQLRQQFGGSNYNSSEALENQLASAAFYLITWDIPEKKFKKNLMKYDKILRD